MLKPAVLYKMELEKLFAERIYTDEYFYYMGYAGAFSTPDISNVDNRVQYAIVDTNNNVIGYMAYRIYLDDRAVNNFGLYSFNEGSLIVAQDLFEEMERLCNTFHRIEYRMISGNHVERSYDKFCKSHNGTKITLHDVCKDMYGNYHDEYIYEIINNCV